MSIAKKRQSDSNRKEGEALGGVSDLKEEAKRSGSNRPKPHPEMDDGEKRTRVAIESGDVS